MFKGFKKATVINGSPSAGGRGVSKGKKEGKLMKAAKWLDKKTSGIQRMFAA